MKAIDITPYKVKIRGLDTDGKEEVKEVDYNFKNALVNVLFAEGLHLTAKQTVYHSKIATKVEACESNELRLEDAEYDALKDAVNKVSGFSRNDVEFISRILDAKQIN